MGAFHIRAVSEDEARKEFLDKVKTLGLNDSLAYALYRVMKECLRPNVEFDEAQTKIKREEARNMVKPIVVKVRSGDTLVDSDTSPSAIVSERIKAYKSELEKRDGTFSFASGSVEFVFCLLLMMTGALFIVISKTQKNKQPRTIAIFCTLLLLNLGLERTIVEMGNTEYFDSNTPLLQILAYVTPIMLGPIIQVLLFGSYTGFIMALMVAAITTFMLGEGIVYFVIFLASAIVAIYFCSSATSRPQVIFGGVIYGLFISAISFNNRRMHRAAFGHSLASIASCRRFWRVDGFGCACAFAACGTYIQQIFKRDAARLYRLQQSPFAPPAIGGARHIPPQRYGILFGGSLGRLP